MLYYILDELFHWKWKAYLWHHNNIQAYTLFFNQHICIHLQKNNYKEQIQNTIILIRRLADKILWLLSTRNLFHRGQSYGSFDVTNVETLFAYSLNRTWWRAVMLSPGQLLKMYQEWNWATDIFGPSTKSLYLIQYLLHSISGFTSIFQLLSKKLKIPRHCPFQV